MMAQHCLTIRTRNEPVVLERLLQVTRYRGFELTAMDMRPLAEFGSMLITLNISSDKPISLLTNQLNKLVAHSSRSVVMPVLRLLVINGAF